MFTARGTVIVHRPIQEVFDFLSNVDRYSEWQHSAYTVQHETGGALRANSRVRDSRNILGQTMQHTYEIVEHNPPNTFTVRTAEGPVPFTFKWTLEPLEDSTRIIFEGEGQWRGTSHNEEQVAYSGERLLEADLRTLKELLEHERLVRR